MPGVLSQVWGAADATQRGDVATIARQLDTLVTGMGFARPDAIPSPASFTATDPATRVDAWETWFNGVANTAGVMPTSQLVVPTTSSPSGWSATLALARTRTVPAEVLGYLSVQAATWASIAPHWATPAEAAAIIANAQRAAESWWFARIGGATGTPAAWRRGDTAPDGSSTAGGPVGGGDNTGLKLLAAALGGWLLLRRRR